MNKKRNMFYYLAIANLLSMGAILISNIPSNAYEVSYERSVSNQGVVNTASLNVRSGAGTSYQKIGSLTKGTKIDIKSTQNGWHEITYNNKKAFVSATYIDIVNNNSTTTEKVTHTGVVNTTTLNVRKGANTSYSKIGSLSKNTKVEIVRKESNGWYKIKYGAGYGYISGDYISNVVAINNDSNNNQSSSGDTTTEKVTHTGTVNTTTLNVRKGANTSYSKIGSLSKGTKVEIVKKESNGWYKIKYSSGYGYVSGDYISNVVIIGSTTPDNKPDIPSDNLPVLKTGNVIKTDSLNVRNGYGVSYSVIGTLKENEKVEIVGESNGWYKIKYKNGYGHVSGSYIKLIENKPEQKPEEKPDNPIVEAVINKGTVINTPWLTVRSGSNISSSSLGSIAEGTVVEITKNENGWYRIKYGNGYGYVGSNYIKLIEDNTQIPSTPDTKPDDGTNNPSIDESEYVVKTTTNYNFTLEEYIAKQQLSNPKYYDADYYKKYIDPSQAKNMFQFLRINTYRNVDKDKLNAKLSGKGVLSGQAQAILDASKKQNIDPIYLTAQSLHETGNGTSTLAKGVTITEIANKEKEIKDEKGNLIGYEMIPLDKPVTVYNLYGIGAYDNLNTFPNRALVLGTTHAYNNGWTSVEKAIEGASEYVSKNYANNTKYNQNTIFKYRYNPSNTYLWHQYATSPWYAESIGATMESLKDCYTSDNKFTFDIPVFNS